MKGERLKEHLNMESKGRSYILEKGRKSRGTKRQLTKDVYEEKEYRKNRDGRMHEGETWKQTMIQNYERRMTKDLRREIQKK